MTRKEVRARIAQYLIDHPDLTYRDVGLILGCATSTVSGIAREYGVSRQRKALSATDLEKLEG